MHHWHKRDKPVVFYHLFSFIYYTKNPPEIQADYRIGGMILTSGKRLVKYTQGVRPLALGYRMAPRQSEGLLFLWKQEPLIGDSIFNKFVKFIIAHLVFSEYRPGDKIHRLQRFVIVRCVQSDNKMLSAAIRHLAGQVTGKIFAQFFLGVFAINE